MYNLVEGYIYAYNSKAAAVTDSKSHQRDPT
jgi:hypothetical protein